MKIILNFKIIEDFGEASERDWEQILKMFEDIALNWKKVFGEEVKCNLDLYGAAKKDAEH